MSDDLDQLREVVGRLRGRLSPDEARGQWREAVDDEERRQAQAKGGGGGLLTDADRALARGDVQGSIALKRQYREQAQRDQPSAPSTTPTVTRTAAAWEPILAPAEPEESNPSA